MFIRNSGVLHGVVEAPDRQAAEAAAAEQFSLTAEELEHVLIIERLEILTSGQRRPPKRFVAWVLRAMKRFVAWALPAMNRFVAWALPAMNRFVAWALRAMNRFVAWALRAMKRFLAWVLPAMKRFMAWALRAMKRFVAWALPAMNRFVAQHPVLVSAVCFIGVLAFYIVASASPR
jgi:hypothetical protein